MGKHDAVNVYEKYDEEGETEQSKCPRCGSFLAEHEERKTCGNCGFSEIEK